MVTRLGSTRILQLMLPEGRKGVSCILSPVSATVPGPLGKLDGRLVNKGMGRHVGQLGGGTSLLGLS